MFKYKSNSKNKYIYMERVINKTKNYKKNKRIKKLFKRV